jgi:hypothetical protein
VLQSARIRRATELFWEWIVQECGAWQVVNLQIFPSGIACWPSLEQENPVQYC